MIDSCPDPVAPAPTGPMEMEQMEPLELLPSPSWLASTSRQAPPEPHDPDPHTVQVSSLIVGCSTSSDEQLQPGDLKACGKVTAQSYHIMSDRRLKHEVLPLHIDAAAILGQLDIVEFKFNDDAQGQRQVGVIAQDVLKVLEDAVTTDGATDLKSIKLDLLQFITMKALQDFLPLLIELDKQHRLGLPLLMHTQQHAAAQHSSTPSWENLSARTQRSQDMSDTESECETHMSAIADSGMQHSSDSSDCHSDAQPSSSNPSAPPGFKDDAAMVAHILAALGEDNKGMPVIALKLLRKLGKESVWSTFLEAQYTRLPAADGKARSPGSTFLHLLKKKEQQAKIA